MRFAAGSAPERPPAAWQQRQQGSNTCTVTRQRCFRQDLAMKLSWKAPPNPHPHRGSAIGRGLFRSRVSLQPLYKIGQTRQGLADGKRLGACLVSPQCKLAKLVMRHAALHLLFVSVVLAVSVCGDDLDGVCSESGVSRSGECSSQPSGNAGSRVRVVFLHHSLDMGGVERQILSTWSAVDRRRIAAEVVLFQDLGSWAAKFEDAGLPVRLFRVFASDRVHAFLSLLPLLPASGSPWPTRLCCFNSTHGTDLFPGEDSRQRAGGINVA